MPILTHLTPVKKCYNTPFRKNENKYVYLAAKHIIKRNLLAVWAKVCDGRQKNIQM